MHTKSQKAGKKPGSKMRFPGIGADAKALEMSPSFLWLCLTGRKDRPDVVESYWNLKRQQAQQFLSQTPEAA